MTDPAHGGTAGRLVVGISGATGIALGVRVLELARSAGFETRLVVTPAAQQTRALESDLAGVPRWGAPDLTRSNHDGLHRRAPVR